jgi:hypothetical protein
MAAKDAPNATFKEHIKMTPWDSMMGNVALK